MIVIDTVLQLASNVAGAIKEFFGFQGKKLDLKNANDMKLTVEAQEEQAATDKTNDEIAKGDIDAIRKELGE